MLDMKRDNSKAQGLSGLPKCSCAEGIQKDSGLSLGF